MIRWNDKHKSRVGFTIVELLVVIVILAILATITVVAFKGVQDKANNASVDSAMDTYAKALQLYRTNNGRYPLPQDIPERNAGQQGWYAMCVGKASDYPATSRFTAGSCTTGSVLNLSYQGNIYTSTQLQDFLKTEISTLPSIISLTDTKMNNYSIRGIIYTPWYGYGSGTMTNTAQFEYELFGKNAQCAQGWGNAGYFADGVRCAMTLP